MATIEHMETVANAISKLKYSMRICSSRAPELSTIVALKIQGDFKDGKISQGEYTKEMAILNKVIESFQSECSCNKRYADLELILPLKEAPKVESKIMVPPKIHS